MSKIPGRDASSSNSHTFLTLDALRGIAALTVIIFHTNDLFGTPLFEHAYLAVDFFFMLSGFVLSYAYQQRLDDGYSFFTFMKARLIRLYPLYLVGLLAGFVYSLITFLHAGTAGISKLLFLLSTGLLLLPAPRPADYPGIAAFPYNAFSWSMFYELLANVLHAALLRRRSTSSILAIASTAGLILCGMIVHFGSNLFGILTRDLPFALARVTFSYLVGVLLYRFWNRHRNQQLISPLWSVVLFLVTVSIPTPHQGSAVLDIALLLFVLPSIVLLGSFSQPSGFGRPAAVLLGTVSYAIYILSMPVLGYLHQAWRRIFGRPDNVFIPWSGISLVIILFLIAWAADYVYDIPVRRWLTRRFGGTRAAQQIP